MSPMNRHAQAGSTASFNMRRGSNNAAKTQPQLHRQAQVTNSCLLQKLFLLNWHHNHNFHIKKPQNSFRVQAVKPPPGVEFPKEQPQFKAPFLGFTKTAEIWNSSACMIRIIGVFTVELICESSLFRRVAEMRDEGWKGEPLSISLASMQSLSLGGFLGISHPYLLIKGRSRSEIKADFDKKIEGMVQDRCAFSLIWVLVVTGTAKGNHNGGRWHSPVEVDDSVLRLKRKSVPVIERKLKQGFLGWLVIGGQKFKGE
ncbi:hypothetical protein K1719_011558 [Acacia pycnantha]|nr:hypothetical protein K1719_011558 [Acacia pycnantha]